jgi:hypothetical protein
LHEFLSKESETFKSNDRLRMHPEPLPCTVSSPASRIMWNAVGPAAPFRLW